MEVQKSSKLHKLGDRLNRYKWLILCNTEILVLSNIGAFVARYVMTVTSFD